MGSRLSAVPAWPVAFVVLALVLGACTGTEPDVVHGQGRIPPAIPDDFPMPPGAVIGSTLIDRVQTETRFEIEAPHGLETLAQFFGVALVNAGYVVDGSAGGASRWTVEFRRGDLEGTIEVRPSSGGGSVASISVNDA